MYIVKVNINLIESYIKKVISYDRNIVNTVIIKENAFHYKHEENAIKSAQHFKGNIEIE
jgi:hypothetical protein